MIPAEACPKCGAEERHFNTGWSGVGGTYSCDNQVIPTEAIEAAVGAYMQYPRTRGIDNTENMFRAALEAAAPHMQQVVTTQDELDALPLNSVILDRERLPLHKDDSDRIEEWCYGDNVVDVMLPATLIHRPTL